MEREAVLMKIKAAEKEAKVRRERAEQQAAAIKEKAASEAGSIVASAESEGHRLLKEALDAARAEEEKKRESRLAVADKEAAAQKDAAFARKSQVIEAVVEMFAREYDV